MAVINSYYLYQKYEKRGNQPWIPSYPNTWSIDGDGTMPIVLKEQDDPSCYHPIYRWVQTEDTICIDTSTIDVRTTSGDPYCNGYDKYVDTTTEQSFDGGVTWEFVSSSTTLVETDSEYCGYHPTPEVQYRWTESGTTCDNANKYKRYIKEVSYDGGYVWIVVTPPQYSAGTLVEADSYDCGYRTSATTSATYCSNANQYVDVYSLVSRDYGTTWTTASTSTELVDSDVYECGYRTGTTSGDPYCQGDDKYVDVYYRVSRDYGTTWITASTTPTLVEVGGCATPEVQYRWTPSGWTCVGYDKYQNNIKEQSTDGGETWTVVIPEEYSASTLIESQSTDCGYVPPTTDGKFKLTLSDSSIVSAACDSTSSVTRGEVSSQYSGTVVSAEIGDCVTSIGDFTFSYCSSLTSVTISDSITTISMAAFQGCSSLASITIPNSVTTIGTYAFNQCTGLTSVDIPSGATSIGASTFRSCSSLTSIDIPSVVTSIGNNAFNGCSGLASITVNVQNPPTLGSRAFDDTNNCPIYVPCASVETYKAATKWSTYASRIEGIPPCGQPTPSGNKFTLTLSDSSTVTAACDSTSAITHDEISAYTASTVAAEIGECVTTIAGSAFYNCRSLTSVTIPNSVTSIKNQTFRGCTSLASIVIPNSVTSIGSQAFYKCSSLSSVTIPSGVTSISDYTFTYCSGLTGLTIPNSVTSIGGSAFSNCSGLTSVSIPSGVTSISDYTFSYCSSLASVDIPSSVTTIGNSAFNECSSLTSIDIPSGVTSIGNSSFYNCSSLTSVTIPNSVTSIGASAFSYCRSLTSIDIPSGITIIDYQAFNNCSSLTSVIVNAQNPPTLGNYVFSNTNNCPIYVPSASVEAYKAAWSTYASRIQPIT